MFKHHKKPVKIISLIRNKFIEQKLIEPDDILNEEVIDSKLELYLIEEAKLHKPESFFQLGQLYFDNERYEDSFYYFNEGMQLFTDKQCTFQLGVQYYDGLGCDKDPELGCGLMKKILDCVNQEDVSHLKFSAAYNLGRAYYEGYGVKQSDETAEKYWMIAADDGNPLASVPAQSALGFFYSTKDHFDLSKAFFWHSEACGNGSVESQASLGVMYLYGLGVGVDWEASLICLANAADRGSIYAKANLCYYFYKRKLFTKAAALSAQVSQSTKEDLEEISKSNSMVIYEFLCKGVSIACFIFGRCLHLGVGVQKDCDLAKEYYKKSFDWDKTLCADFQGLVNIDQL